MDVHGRGRGQPERSDRQRHSMPARSRARKEVVTTEAYTVEEVADMLKVGRDKIYALLRTGELNSIKIGKLRRITDEHLAEFVAVLEEKNREQS